jgi:hypothetical protein
MGVCGLEELDLSWKAPLDANRIWLRHLFRDWKLFLNLGLWLVSMGTSEANCARAVPIHGQITGSHGTSDKSPGLEVWPRISQAQDRMPSPKSSHPRQSGAPIRPLPQDTEMKELKSRDQ